MRQKTKTKPVGVLRRVARRAAEVFDDEVTQPFMLLTSPEPDPIPPPPEWADGSSTADILSRIASRIAALEAEREELIMSEVNRICGWDAPMGETEH